MNIEQARFNMIEQQIRPWNVLDITVLDLLSKVKRETFVPAGFERLAFSDTEVPLPCSQSMLPPRVEARFLQALLVRKNERVLEIGTGSGYMASLLAELGASVVSVEIEAALCELAENNLRRANVHNVQVVHADGAAGWNPASEKFDIIVLSGSMPLLPQVFCEQLNPGGRLVAIVGEAPVMTARLITKDSQGQLSAISLFETDAPVFKNVITPSRFHF